MADEEVIVKKDYVDNFSIKEFAFEKLSPKYFDGIDDLSKLNIGSIGYVTEQISNVTEDAFNTAATLIKEAFPSRAQIPESIYSHAGIYQLSNQFANPSQCTFIVVFKESDILEYGTLINDYYKLVIDKDTMIQVEDKYFRFDYDIILKAKKYNGDYVYSAQYDKSYDNSLSNIQLPYIKARRSGDGHLAIFTQCKQYAREVFFENIINNSKLNYPVITEEFENQLAGIDVFYRTAGTQEYIQLAKKLAFTTPIKSPFCYYNVVDDNKIQFTFSSKDNYFQPAFNSELKIILYTTNGSEGDFETYTGNNVMVITNSELYSSNENLIISAKPLTGSVNGNDKLGLEALQALTVEAYSTAKSYTTSNDLELYFNNYKYRYNNIVKFFKKRDDLVERLYSGFMILKKDEYIYPTNTLIVKTTTDKFDIDADDTYILKPGHIFTYSENSSELIDIVPNKMIYDENLVINDDFAFTNPYLILVNRKPNLVGFYNTMVNQDAILDFTDINDQSFIQFAANKIQVVRNLEKDSKYEVTLNLMPSSSIDDKFINVSNAISQLSDDEFATNNLRVIMAFYDSNEMIGYIEMNPTNVPDDNSNCEFKARILTDDYITSNNKFRCLNAKHVNSSLESDYVYIPMINSVVKIFTLYKTGTSEKMIFSNIDSMYNGYIITNIYNTEYDKITFIKPMNMIRSTVIYNRLENTNELGVKLTEFPVIKYDLITDKEKFSYFVKTFLNQYSYLIDAVKSITNNMNLDIKFYNTYGKSKNYTAGEEDLILDKVNLQLRLKIALVSGTNEQDSFKNIKKYIKSYVETLNDDGGNEFFISNLIQDLKNKFPEIDHLKFLGINDYDASIQSIRNNTKDLNTLSMEERRNYVPEFLVMNTDSIEITSYE